jgi:hypothetical protein
MVRDSVGPAAFTRASSAQNELDTAGPAARTRSASARGLALKRGDRQEGAVPNIYPVSGSWPF